MKFKAESKAKKNHSTEYSIRTKNININSAGLEMKIVERKVIIVHIV